MTLNPSDTLRSVVEKVPKSEDLELHVGWLSTPFGKYVEIRDFIPSRQIYGRGILFPEAQLDTVADALGLMALEGLGTPEDTSDGE